MNPIKKIVLFVLKMLIRIYQAVISPMLGPACRHVPRCSEYAYQALDQHGPFRGLKLAVKRLMRCHPWGTSGYDPVPEEKQS